MLGNFEGNVDKKTPLLVMEMQIDNDEDNGANLNGLQEASKPLYQGIRSTTLAATMLFMNICTIDGVSNKFVDELLSFLHKYLLQIDNCLPKNMYHAKTLTKRVGFNYKTIHACPNGCVLF
jgi:hypothetical protein